MCFLRPLEIFFEGLKLYSLASTFRGINKGLSSPNSEKEHTKWFKKWEEEELRLDSLLQREIYLIEEIEEQQQQWAAEDAIRAEFDNNNNNDNDCLSDVSTQTETERQTEPPGPTLSIILDTTLTKAASKTKYITTLKTELSLLREQLWQCKKTRYDLWRR